MRQLGAADVEFEMASCCPLHGALPSVSLAAMRLATTFCRSLLDAFTPGRRNDAGLLLMQADMLAVHPLLNATAATICV